jgi:hypothetical protein
MVIFPGRRVSVPTDYKIESKAMDFYEHQHNTDALILTRQSNDQLGYVSEGIFATTGSNTFVGDQIVSGNLDVSGNLTANALFYNYTSTGSISITGSISTIDYIDFVTNPTPTPTHLEGRIHWNADTKTLQVDTDTNNFMIEVGHQNVVRGRNSNSFTLIKGTIVYMNGESGNRPNFYTASWEDDTRSASTLGFIVQDIGANQTGYVITNGILRGINTSAYTPGQPLYLSSSGKFTTIVPDAPQHEVRLGKIITSAVDGTLYVNVMNGYELNELHDLKIYTGSLNDAATNNGGSLIYYSSSLWTNNDEVRLQKSTMILATVSESLNFANDAAAQAGGVPAGGLYHTNGTVKIRLV